MFKHTKFEYEHFEIPDSYGPKRAADAYKTRQNLILKRPTRPATHIETNKEEIPKFQSRCHEIRAPVIIRTKEWIIIRAPITNDDLLLVYSPLWFRNSNMSHNNSGYFLFWFDIALYVFSWCCFVRVSLFLWRFDVGIGGNLWMIIESFIVCMGMMIQFFIDF